MAETIPAVSVVMVSYNTGPILARAMEAVLAQEGLHELIVVDNGNPAEVMARLDAWAAREAKLRIIRGQGNVGFARGCNLGVHEASGTYLLLLNPDCIIPRGALKNVVSELEAHEEAWLAGCCMTGPDGENQGGSKRHLLTPRIALSEALQLWRINKQLFSGMHIKEQEDEVTSEYVPAISGAFMLMRRDKYLEIGGIDEGYFFHVEDLDFCYHINALGGKVLYVPSVRAVHYRSSSKVSSLFIERNKAHGFIRYFNKHFTQQYGRWFTWVSMAGIHLRLALRAVLGGLRDVFSYRKTGEAGRRHKKQVAFLYSRVEPEVGDGGALKIMAPVLLIGSTGQVGLSILRRLLAHQVEVCAMFHTETVDVHHPNLKWIQGSAMAEKIDLAGHTPHTLVYTAAIWHLPKHLDALAKAGVKRLVCFSSTSIMGKASSQNAYEQQLVRQFTEAEQAVAKKCDQLGIAWTILRPTMIYGIGLDRNVSSIVAFIQRLGFFPIASPGDGLRQPVHTDDLAQAVITALPLAQSYSKRYTLGGGEQLSYRAMVERIASVMGRTPRVLSTRYLPHVLDVFSFVTGKKEVNGEIAKRMNQDLVFDDSAARDDLGYAPRGFLQAGKQDLGLEPLPAAEIAESGTVTVLAEEKQRREAA